MFWKYIPTYYTHHSQVC